MVVSIPTIRAENPVKITVLGCGSFGTANASVLASKGHDVVMLGRNEEVIRSINEEHRNAKYLTDCSLPENISATTDAEAALDGTKWVIMCVPVQQARKYLESLRHLIPASVPVVSTCKGIELSTLCLMNEIIPQALQRPEQPIGFLSGPTFAKELVRGVPSAVVCAADTEELATRVQNLFHTGFLRTYRTTDVIGVEIGGALKNVIAIAAGCAAGMEMGHNTCAGLVTRGIQEINRIALTMGADPMTLGGLAGIGDLMLTCYGAASRNRTVGFRIGQGETMEQIRASMKEVAEGVPTTFATLELCEKLKIPLEHMRICVTVSRVLAGEMKPEDFLIDLASLPLRKEFEYGDIQKTETTPSKDLIDAVAKDFDIEHD